MSIIQLQRAERSLWAFGHPKEGYTLNIEENDLSDGTEITKVTSPANLIAHHEVITRFQAFRDGDESWLSKYEWETQTSTPTARAIKKVLVLVLTVAMLFFLLKFVFKLF